MNAEKPRQGVSETEVRFSIHSSAARGIANNLFVFKQLRKLGLSLGYIYHHEPLKDFRSVSRGAEWLSRFLLLRWSQRLINFLRRAIFCPQTQRIYYFLGLEAYLLSRNTNSKRFLENYKLVSLVLADYVLKRENISSLETLQRFIREFASERKVPNRFLLLRLHWRYPAEKLNSLIKLIPSSIDDLDFRTIYFQCGKGHSRKSSFPECGVKTLIHIRQGDRGVIKSPWGTWLCAKDPGGAGPKGWREYRDENEVRHLSVPDFYRFTQSLATHYAGERFGIQFFSDGFERTLHDIALPATREYLNLTRQKMRLLNKNKRHYQRAFDILRNVPDSTCFIGEKAANLFRLLHAFMEADLIVTGVPMQHTFISYLLSVYPGAERKPIVVCLHKPGAAGLNAMDANGREALDDTSEFVFIDIDSVSPDFSELTECLAGLRSSYPPPPP